MTFKNNTNEILSELGKKRNTRENVDCVKFVSHHGKTHFESNLSNYFYRDDISKKDFQGSNLIPLTISGTPTIFKTLHEK